MVLSKKKPKVYVVTSLPVDVKKDRDARMWKYSIMMSVRMVAIILMFFIPWPYNLLPILAAILLPWFAVVIANQVTAGNSLQIESPQKSLE